jgi:nucleoside-diphosphate-sugar epimerase
MIVDGGGLIATAFRERAGPTVHGLVFARGVPDSTTADEKAYAREREMLTTALATARASGEPLVYLTGAHIFGPFHGIVTESSPTMPITRYGRHQLQCESMVRDGGPHLILRLPNVVGPGGNRRQLVPALVHQVLAGLVVVREDATRDLLDVSDLVELTERLLDAGVRDKTLNLASGVSASVSAVVDRIASVLDEKPFVWIEPGGEAQRFDVSLLDSLVGPLPFDAAYPFQVIDRYVPTIAASLRSST